VNVQEENVVEVQVAHEKEVTEAWLVEEYHAT
jgi:hypothetical protein